ncbi:MAG: hypothetical protein H0W64_08090 [Gammaproteobacteria bacterium]|nr:hypothetical protein [Gammaproteobacteria bacterium]
MSRVGMEDAVYLFSELLNEISSKLRFPALSLQVVIMLRTHIDEQLAIQTEF